MLSSNKKLFCSKMNLLQDKINSAKNEMKIAEEALDNNDNSYSEHLKNAYEIMQNEFINFREFIVENVDDVEFIKELFDAEIETSGIEISKLDNNIIKISMPIITPFVIYKKKKLYSKDGLTSREIDAIDRSDFMIDTLERAIIKFLKENKINRKAYQKKTLIYVNFFDKGGTIPDTDNYSYKAFTDLITGYFTSSSDKALNTDFIIKTACGDKTHTEIYLIPTQFNSFIQKITTSNFDCNSQGEI